MIIEMSSEQMKQVLHGLQMRRAELERYNPNMKIEAIECIIDLQFELQDILSGVPMVRLNAVGRAANSSATT